ncbi:MAG: hypothetical protein H0W09_00780, partial [Solirubrobacterales bacterium]|nr:hypothetical protein [Solirubrobacterales bacterium]
IAALESLGQFSVLGETTDELEALPEGGYDAGEKQLEQQLEQQAEEILEDTEAADVTGSDQPKVGG